ncbi:MAG: tripartite tricarboxylate transporter substrate binding protein, partial [Burkholderiales bacterium]
MSSDYAHSRLTVAVILGALLTSAVFGQSPTARAFPERPVRLIVPYPPGGGSDVIARILAPRLSEGLGQQVVIDNRAGAATIIGLDLLAKSPPDGYTFGIATSTLAVNSTLNKSLPFDTIRDFAPIMLAADGLYVLVVHPGVPARSVRDLVALSRSAPGKLNAAIAGSGTPMHMGLAQFNSTVGASIPGVIYKGAGPALASLLGGETQLAFISMPTVVTHIQAGKLRALAVTAARRSPAAPDLPTASEAGLPGFVLSGWYGFLAPAKTGALQVDRLNAELRTALAHAEVKRKLLEFGADVVASTP